MKCYLRSTKIKLADGKTYTFRALPFNRKTVDIVAAMLEGDSDVDRMKSMLDAVETSLSYDQTPEQVAEILDAGLVPMLPGPDGSDDARVHGEIMGALIAQAR